MKINDFDTLPILEFTKIPTHGHIEVELNEFSAPLMKGIDPCGRPFIALRVKDRKTSEILSLTLFQRYEDDYDWTWWIRSVSGILLYLDLKAEIFNLTRITRKQKDLDLGFSLNPANEAKLSQIIHHQHSRFDLV